MTGVAPETDLGRMLNDRCHTKGKRRSKRRGKRRGKVVEGKAHKWLQRRREEERGEPAGRMQVYLSEPGSTSLILSTQNHRHTQHLSSSTLWPLLRPLVERAPSHPVPADTHTRTPGPGLNGIGLGGAPATHREPNSTTQSVWLSSATTDLSIWF